LSDPVPSSQTGAPPFWRGQAVQAVVTIAVVILAAWYLWHQWDKASTARVTLRFAPAWLGAATLIVLGTYALLIEVWRRVLSHYDSVIPFAPAARVWFVSNLGKYVPGKVWQVTTMTLMLSQLRVPVATAASASAIITIANVAAGFGLVVVIGMPALRAVASGHDAAILIAGSILVVALLAAPFVMRVVSSIASRLLRRPLALTVPARGAWLAVLGCLVGWVLYGCAFQLFVRSLLGTASAPWITYVTAYTLSYLIGYLALFLPGGIGAREVSLSYLLITLQAATPAEATIITIASRLWLTVLEIVPGVLFLFVRPAAGTAPRLSP